MSDSELIAKLKDPKQARPFGLLSDEEQAILERATKRNCLWYTGSNEFCQSLFDGFTVHYTYVLKPDYEPEPDYEDIEIVECRGLLGIWNHHVQGRGRPYPGFPYDFIHLHCVVSLPTFEQIVSKNEGRAEQLILPADVAKYKLMGHNVVARFVKD
ncbi:MAG: hypothetical protein ACYSUP_16850 [Planctomycetota bacterium]